MSTELPTLERVQEENRVLREELEQKNAEIEKLRHRLDQLCRHVFGRRAEQVDPNQLKLAFAMLQAQDAGLPPPAPPTPAATSAPRRIRSHGRRQLPENLPRERVEIHPLPEDRRCRECGEEMRPMKGAELATQMDDFEPASFFIREYARVKYSCPRHEEAGVVCPELPPMPIVKGQAGAGVLAHIATCRFSDHLPYHRLEAIFKRHGVTIARSTMCDWMGELEFSLRPIYDAIVVQTSGDTSNPANGCRPGLAFVYRVACSAGKSPSTASEKPASRRRLISERACEPGRHRCRRRRES